MLRNKLNILAGLMAALVLAAACGRKSPETEEFLIKVDSIHHPDTVMAGKTFAVRFYGTIGPDGCHRFLRFETEYQTDVVKIWTVGQRSTGNRHACPEIIPMLDGTALNLRAPDSGTLVIKVVNPGLGNVLTSTAFVKRGN